MKKFLLVLVLALSVACSPEEEDAPTTGQTTDAPGADFTMTGTVTAIRPGVDLPDGIPDIDATTDVGADAATETDEPSVQTGTIVVESDEEIDGCEADADGYTVYVITETTVTPLATDLDSLEDQKVEVNGTAYETDDDPCVLVAQTIEVSDEGADPATSGDPDATFSPGPRPSTGASPVGTSS